MSDYSYMMTIDLDLTAKCMQGKERKQSDETRI